jgi:hypothetical protein
MPDAALLTRGKLSAAPIGAGATTYLQGPSGTNVIQCEGDSELTVNVDMTGGAAADIGVTCEPIGPDGSTPLLISLPVVNSSPPTFAGGHAYFSATYDVSGLDAVRLGIKNNNAGAQTVTMSWRLT